MNLDISCAVCPKPGSKLCSACHGVRYCSVEHQKRDWKVHREICRCYEIKMNDQFGRYLVAKRDIPAGTIIMNEPAIMLGPSQDTLPICLGCYKKLGGLKKNQIYYCSQCLIFPMCGPVCEKLPIHAENECKLFSTQHHQFTPIRDLGDRHPAYECIMAIRCLMLKENDRTKWNKLVNMQAQNENRKAHLPLLWIRNEVNVVHLLKDKFEMKGFSDEEIHSVLGYTDINAFETKATGMTGLFDNTFIMAHDCIPNTHHSFTEDFKMVVRASIPIMRGEPITTAYVQTLDGTFERRTELWESKFVDCKCKRCADPTELGTNFSALKCSKCPEGFLFPKNPVADESVWICSSRPQCQFQMTHWEGTGRTILIRTELEKIKVVDGNVIPKLEMFLEKYKSRLLHPNHFLIIEVENSLLSLYGGMKPWLIQDLTLDQLERKEALCLHVLQVISILEPGYSRIRGVTLYELHLAVYLSANIKFQRKFITEEQLKEHLEEVLELLSESYTILSFDSLNIPEGQLAKSIPARIAIIKANFPSFNLKTVQL